jgi:hypothetical protein
MIVVDDEDDERLGIVGWGTALWGWTFVVVRILKLDENKLTEQNNAASRGITWSVGETMSV